MSSLYLFDIEKLKSEFQGILQTYHEIIKKRKTLAIKLAELKTTYQELVKHNTKKIFLFCLDSFYFQYKTLILEMDHLSRSVASINNRMYGDYYKLYHIILVQLSESNHDLRTIETDHNKYTPYKDLEPFHEYKMSDIISIHADILKLMNYLYTHFIKKSQTIVDYNNTARGGISITSFLHTLEYENTLVREQIGLYTSYIGFFHASQKKYLSKLFSKVQEFYTEIEDDILANHQHRQSTAAAIDTKQLEEFYTLAEEDPTEIELLLCATENLLDMDDEYVSEKTGFIDGIDITEQAQDLSAQDLSAQDLSAQDLQSRGLQSRGLQSRGLQSRGLSEENEAIAVSTEMAAILFSRSQKLDSETANNLMSPNDSSVSSLDETMQPTSVEPNVRAVIEDLDNSTTADELTDDLSGNSA